jgi:predicted site-specific integrase-resolvase
MDTKQSPDDLLNEQELCDWIRIKVITVRKWRIVGRGPLFQRIGTLVRYRRGDVQAWLDSNRHQSTAEYERAAA